MQRSLLIAGMRSRPDLEPKSASAANSWNQEGRTLQTSPQRKQGNSSFDPCLRCLKLRNQSKELSADFADSGKNLGCRQQASRREPNIANRWDLLIFCVLSASICEICGSCLLIAQLQNWRCGLVRSGARPHSHSIVLGGLELMSYTTRFTPRTSLMIRVEIRPSTSYGMGYQSAVMKSSVCTARTAITSS